MTTSSPSPAEIRAARAEHADMRDRDFAAKLNITEAQLVAAYVGQGVTAISADTNAVFAEVASLGEVMALTRNDSCVIEKVGTYDNFHAGEHAAMVLTEEIDLRIFGRHFAHAFAVEREGKDGPRRSLQFFDASGEAMHKIHLRAGSDVAAYEALVQTFALDTQSDILEVAAPPVPEGAKGDPAKAETLRAEWGKMTDTHQFQRLCSKLKMNRLGAYRMVGAPQVHSLPVEAVDMALHQIQSAEIDVMIFVGSRGCIEIHGGPVKTLRRMGPWQNVLDPGFDMHLRLDHIAEVWAVNKPTKRGAARSLEAFDAEGNIILQIFGRGTEARDYRPEWAAILDKMIAEAEAGTLTDSYAEAV